ncbi:DNA methyltransferase [Clostridium nigeriense]|uniref:DNA methyltransferase n=1 Tax=Clostridium nigeriense TaxID=1805470 RepID=UPI003D357EAC
MFEYNNKIINNYDYLYRDSTSNKIKNDGNIDEIKLSDNDRLSNPIFKSIGYPSKIYYKNIQKFIKQYTDKGAIVLDSCCGSGSTGIAALLEERMVILSDNSPQAINITFNILNYIDLNQANKEYKKLLNNLEGKINYLYKVNLADGSEGYAESIIESSIYLCPECGERVILYETATGKRSEYKCKNCDRIINISKKEDKTFLLEKRKPVEANIVITKSKGKRGKIRRNIEASDLELWQCILEEYKEKYSSLWKPTEKIIYNRCYPRPGGWPGFDINSSVSDLFTEKNIIALQILNDYIESNILDDDIKTFFKFVFTEILFRTSSRLFTTSGIKNVYHIPAVGKVQNVMAVFKRKYSQIIKAKEFLQQQTTKECVENNIRIMKNDAKKLNVNNNSIDYAFIDPPYGGVVPYAELNLFYSAWLGEKEDLQNEIIIPMDYDKKIEFVERWGNKLEAAFKEVYRVLKPGAYFTIVFQSRFNEIWNELRDIMNNRIGFEFINIVKNDRGTTFHTNNSNDTNPESAFITYRKPINEIAITHIESEGINGKDVFGIFPLKELQQELSLREVQTKIIYLVHKYKLDKVPSDNEIKCWLESICTFSNNKYKLK